MDPLTILIWTGIVIGGGIALYIILNLLVALFALGMIGVTFFLGLFGIALESRKVKKANKVRRARGF